MAFFAVLLAALAVQQVYGASTPRRRATCAGGQQVTNAECCAWFPVLEDIVPNLFGGECGDDAHGALRLTFHDAIGFSRTGGGGGGADGSIIVFNDTELTYLANAGLDDTIDAEAPFIAKHNVTPGDFIQFAGAVSLTLCPGAPRTGFFMGRAPPEAPAPGPDGLVPEPFDNVTNILNRMFDAGAFSPEEVVALLASHSVAGADTIDPTIPGTPFDSSPSIMDTQIFIEVQLKGTLFPGPDPGNGEAMSAVAGEMRLESDGLIARDERTSCFWQEMAGNQSRMQEQFAAAFLKLGMIGHSESSLIDCSDVIPDATPLPDNAGPHLPPTLDQADIQQACATAAFPTFPVLPGPAETVPAIPQS
ncbi:Peroxidase [Mycena chlorophos]|uniref:Peroxidase n=1 Tax=Mycena chlorophos TaxID=658473 RepID=A0A8H6SM49_MYCCL|nr:Peroxidase [Mycena chlorophos]